MYDGQCTGDDGNLEAVGTSKLDRFIRKAQGKFWFKLAAGWIKRALQNPESGLSKMMGSAGANPMTWDDSATFDFKEAEEPMPGYVMKFLAKVVGSTATVYSYLWNYGFIPKVMNLSKTKSENYGGAIPPCALTNAIREFQLFNQISPSDGKLTKETIKKMAEDRCGNHDAKCDTPKCKVEDRYSAQEPSLRRKRYVVRRKKWKVSRTGTFNVAYFYENEYDSNAAGKEGHDHSMTVEVMKKEVEKGLAEWTKYAGLTFIEVDNKKKADVKIRFGSDDHGEKAKKAYFDGPYGVLAHMYYPRNGKMHFDQSENYTAAHEGGGISMHFVAAHEMGHGLGIEHSANPKALMAPYYIGYREQMLLSDDIMAIRHLYGIGNGMVIPKEGDRYIAPEGLATGVNTGSSAVIRDEGTGGNLVVDGDDEGESGEGEKEAERDRCATGDQVSFAETQDLGHCIEGFTAGFADPNEDYIYLFYNENNYIRLESGQQNMRFPKVSPPKTSFAEMFISDMFPGLEGPYDAAVTDEGKKVTYFFVDETVTTWDWATNQIGDLNRVPIENTIFAGLPSEIDAVAKYHHQFLFFSGEMYFIFTEDDGVLDPNGHPALLDGEMIASAFHSFYNGYIYTTTDSYQMNNIYNLMKAKKITTGVSTAEEFQEAVMSSYANIDMDDDTMFGWPCGLGFCGTEIDLLR